MLKQRLKRLERSFANRQLPQVIIFYSEDEYKAVDPPSNALCFVYDYGDSEPIPEWQREVISCKSQ